MIATGRAAQEKENQAFLDIDICCGIAVVWRESKGPIYLVS